MSDHVQSAIHDLADLVELLDDLRDALVARDLRGAEEALALIPAWALPVCVFTAIRELRGQGEPIAHDAATPVAVDRV